MVGVLPDLRSPESIVNEIKEKEKILSDVLNLDKATIIEPFNPQINETKELLRTELDEIEDNTRTVQVVRRKEECPKEKPQGEQCKCCCTCVFI